MEPGYWHDGGPDMSIGNRAGTGARRWRLTAGGAGARQRGLQRSGVGTRGEETHEEDQQCTTFFFIFFVFLSPSRHFSLLSFCTLFLLTFLLLPSSLYIPCTLSAEAKASLDFAFFVFFFP